MKPYAENLLVDLIPGFKQLAIRSTLSYALLSNVRVVVNFAGFIVLARLLNPEVFGTVTLALSMSGLIFLITNWGDHQLIVQEASDDKAYTYGSIGVLLKVFITLILVTVLTLLYPYIISAFSPEIALFLLVFSVAQSMKSIAATVRAFLQRNLDMTKIGLVEAGAAGLSVVLGIGLVHAGSDHWGLAAFYAVPLALPLLAFSVISPFRPQIQCHGEDLYHFVHFGLPILGSTGIQRVRNHGDDFIIGSILGQNTLGSYAVAYRLIRSFHQFVVSALMPALLPTFAKAKEHPERLRRTYEFSLRNLYRIAFPFYSLVGLLAPQIVGLVFGEQWESVPTVVRLLIPFGLVFPLLSINSHFLYAMGQPQLVFRAQLAGLLIFILTLPLLATTFGIQGATISVNLMFITSTIMLVLPIMHHISVNIIQQLAPALLSNVFATAIAALFFSRVTIQSLLLQTVATAGILIGISGIASLFLDRRLRSDLGSILSSISTS